MNRRERYSKQDPDAYQDLDAYDAYMVNRRIGIEKILGKTRIGLRIAAVTFSAVGILGLTKFGLELKKATTEQVIQISATNKENQHPDFTEGLISIGIGAVGLAGSVLGSMFIEDEIRGEDLFELTGGY